MNLFRHRLPEQQEIMQVLGTTTFIVFGWSLGGFFYRFPSFLLGHDIGSLVGILGYMLSFALLETLLILVALILLCVLLPQKWFKEGFAYKGSVTVLIAALAMVQLQDLMGKLESLPERGILYQGLLFTLLITFALILVLQLVKPLQKILLEIVERMQIFAYIYLPLAVVGLLVVIVRNLR
jgi:hypothetical protein